ELNIGSRTLDDKIWIVAIVPDNGPVEYYLYERGGQPRLLFTNNKALEGLKLAKMTPVVIKSRDGLDLVSYYTLPFHEQPAVNDRADDSAHALTSASSVEPHAGYPKPSKPLPMVLDVHGGPWARDAWGY